MPDPFEKQLNDHVERLKHIEAIDTPEFDQILQRSHPSTTPILNLRVVGLCCGVVLLVIASIFRLAAHSEKQQQTSNPETALRRLADLNIDFEAMQLAIDSHFELNQSVEWDTPTDSLLAFSFEDFSNESQIQ